MTGLLIDYELAARHGDIFDNFTYNHEFGRDAAALSDIYSSEVIFRFPLEIERQLAGEIPRRYMTAVRQITNVRPLLAAPIWLKNQIRGMTDIPAAGKPFKDIWNDIIDDFLKLDAVPRPHAGAAARRITCAAPAAHAQPAHFPDNHGRSGWLAAKECWGSELSIARFAPRERDIIENRANYVVYGHTHSHEVVSLDKRNPVASEARRVYVNTGTWGTFHDVLAPNYNRAGDGPSNLVTCVAYLQG